MYVFDILIENTNEEYESFVSDCYSYVYFLQRTGQVLERKHLVCLNGNTVSIPVVCPAKNSLDYNLNSKYCKQVVERIEQNSGHQIQFILKGREAENTEYSIPTNSSFYILRNGWDSALICGDTNIPIPLYTIPESDHDGDDYDNIYFWNRDYQRLHDLWLSSGAYERFAEEQLQNPYSSINKRGRELCSIIEELTGVPTYYFIHNYRDWSIEQDHEQKCPITGNEWIIEGKISSDPIAFKCIESRLVSELSSNSCLEGEGLSTRNHFELSGKLLSYTIGALDYQIASYQKKMEDDKISEDDYSELGNDKALLAVIKNYFEGK